MEKKYLHLSTNKLFIFLKKYWTTSLTCSSIRPCQEISASHPLTKKIVKNIVLYVGNCIFSLLLAGSVVPVAL